MPRLPVGVAVLFSIQIRNNSESPGSQTGPPSVAVACPNGPALTSNLTMMSGGHGPPHKPTGSLSHASSNPISASRYEDFMNEERSSLQERDVRKRNGGA